MDLQVFKTLWGHPGSFGSAIAVAATDGFNGIEGPVPENAAELLPALHQAGLKYIAEICTAGSYVPQRKASVAQHLADLEHKLQRSLVLRPLFVTCIGGCDAWPLKDSVSFFREASVMAESYGLVISFETHRSRSLFNPWVTLQVLESIPEMNLTCDFSHWCVVCERSMDTEMAALERVAGNAFHVHARVGYDQGPQVPDPRAPEYDDWLQAHERWWRMIWRTQADSGRQHSTLTPEFGPDGYLHELPFSRRPVAELRELNSWMAGREREQFMRWSSQVSA